MYIHRLIAVGCLAAALLFAGCDEETRESLSQLTQSVQQMQEGAEEMASSLEEMENEDREPVEPVNFRELRDLLPEQLSGLERTDYEGARQQMGGFTIVQANAQFDGSNRERIEIEMTDIGGAPGLSVLGLGMLTMEVDRESSSGFERTGEYEGHRMHEEYDNNRERGKRTVLVDQRFVVEVSGRNVSFDAIEDAFSTVDLSALQRLAETTG